jgi:hypothetical protein
MMMMMVICQAILGRPFEQKLSNTAKSTGIQCVPPAQRNFPALGSGSNTKDQCQVAPKGKDIVYVHLPNPGMESLGFEWDNHGALGKRLSELAGYREITGAMFLKVQQNIQLGEWVRTQR